MLKESTRCPAAHSSGTEWPHSSPHFHYLQSLKEILFSNSFFAINPQTTRDAFATHTAVKSFKPGVNIWRCSGIFQQMHFVKSLHWTEEPNFRPPQHTELDCFDCFQLYSFLFLLKTNQIPVSLFFHLFTSPMETWVEGIFKKQIFKDSSKTMGRNLFESTKHGQRTCLTTQKTKPSVFSQKNSSCTGIPKGLGASTLEFEATVEKKNHPLSSDLWSW